MLLLAFALLALGLAEGAIRWSGITRVPLYRPDAALGYVLAPSQSGRWRNRLHWAVNERGMPTGRRFEPRADDIVLLGDSVVLGIPQFDLSHTVAAQVEAATGHRVWPIAAGSWALTNELRALAATFAQVPEAAGIGTLVVISNADDFGAPSVWKSDITHPRNVPALESAFLIGKAYRRTFPADELHPASPAQGAERARLLKRLMATYRGRMLWLLYPRRDRLGCAAPELFALGRELAARATVVDIAAAPGWNVAAYRDIYHPNEAGNAMLARIIVQNLMDQRTPSAKASAAKALGAEALGAEAAAAGRPSCPAAADAA